LYIPSRTYGEGDTAQGSLIKLRLPYAVYNELSSQGLAWDTPLYSGGVRQYIFKPAAWDAVLESGVFSLWRQSPGTNQLEPWAFGSEC